jgi:hypothetical protein
VDERAGLAALPRPGDTIDRYRIVAEIARGGMAAVFAVMRSSIGGFEKLLAMKVMLPHLSSEQHFVQMFLDEARLASQIHHPNVCPVFDVGQHEDTPFLLMELVRGRSLSAIASHVRAASGAPPVGPAFWLHALAHAAEGLHAAHEARGSDGKPLGIVHRDVSPQNILVGYDGRVRVVDFGIAAGRGRLTGTRTGELKGKFAYLAPEQVSRDQAIGRTVDVWALGVVAWELIAGRRLFAADDEAKVLWSVMSDSIPDIAREAPELPDAAARAIMACLERDPSRRTATAKEVAMAFASAAAQMAGGRALDLGGPMELFFGSERALEEAKLAAAVTQTGGGALAATAPDATRVEPAAANDEPVTQLATVAPPQAPRRRAAIPLAVGALALAAAAGGAWFLAGRLGGRDTAQGRGAIPALEGSVQGSGTTASPIVTPVIRVNVDPSARLVLVDGMRHDERPIEIPLAGDARAAVEIVGADGSIIKHDIGRDDDGRRPPPAPTRPPALKCRLAALHPLGLRVRRVDQDAVRAR